MEIFPQITVAIKPAAASGLSVGTFKAGDTLRLKILELRGDRALIDFGKFRATADVKIPVNRGDQLLVRVLHSGQQLKMAVVNTVSNPAPAGGDAGQRPQASSAGDLIAARELLKAAVARLLDSAQTGKALPSTLREVLFALQGHFEPLDLNNSTSELMLQLKAIIDNSGLFLEKKLEHLVQKLPPAADPTAAENPLPSTVVEKILSGDLKAGLALVRQLTMDAAGMQNILDSRTLKALGSGIDALLSDIIEQQERAVKQHPGRDLFQAFTFVLPLKAGGRQTRLKVFYPKKKKAEPRNGFRISVLLTMDRLGDIRTDFLMLENDLNLTFFVKDRLAQSRIQENQHYLSAVLTEIFDRVGLKVMVSEKKILEFDRQDERTASERKVDIRI
jgi:hypothetical protein